VNYEYRFNGRRHDLSVEKVENGFNVKIEDEVLHIEAQRLGANSLMLTTDDGNRHAVYSARSDGKVYIQLHGKVHLIEDVIAEEESGGDAGVEIVDGVQRVVAPMPGKLVKVTVEDGQLVAKGTTVCIVEAMKMENVVQAKLDGVVRNIAVNPGDLVDTESVILEIYEEDRIS
jgi:biotin carboxyl carrier protein